MTTEIHVTDKASLMAALKTATGGETIVLADGDYGAIALTGRNKVNIGTFDSPVSIVAANPGAATFSSIDIKYAGNIGFDGIAVRGDFSVMGTHDVSVANSTGSAFSFSYVDGLSFTDNHVSGGNYTLRLGNVANFEITGNLIEKAGADLIQVSRNSYNGLIENNVLYDSVALNTDTHADMIQLYGYGGLTPHDIVIRGNHIYDDPATGAVNAQGIMMTDAQAGGFRNITIEDNLIAVSHVNTILVTGASENVAVLNNSLIAGESNAKAGTIRVAASYDPSSVLVEGNLALRIVGAGTQATVGDNLFYGNAAGSAALFPGLGTSWEDFLTRPGGEGYGALDQLAARLDQARAAAEEEKAAAGGTEEGPAPGDTAVEAPAEAIPDGPRLIAATRDLALGGQIVLPADWITKRDAVAEIAASPALAVAEATLALSFNADLVSGKRAILSRDAAGVDHGLSVWIRAGELNIAFEDGDRTVTLTHAGIKAGTDYDLQIAFGGGQARVWLDGVLVGEAETGMDWRENDEALVLGADGSQSTAGTTDALRWAFYGTLGDVAVYDQAMTPEELAAHRATPLAAPAADGTAAMVAALPDLELAGRLDLPEKWLQLYDPIARVDHAPGLDTAEATLAFGFRTDTLKGGQGLVSKDAAGIDHGLGIWLEGDTLHIAVEDGQKASEIRAEGIRAGTDYDLQVSFGHGVAQAWLDGVLIGQAETGMDWRENDEALVLGADNSKSDAGTESHLRWAFDGRIEGFAIYDEAMTPAELQGWLEAQAPLLG